MKKSNIILISIMGVFLVTTVVIQLHIKRVLSNLEDAPIIELNYSNIKALQVGTGWYINIVQGHETKVTISEDSVENLISLNENILTFKDAKHKKGRINVDITNPLISQLIVGGNSYIKYNTDFIDSMHIIQTEKSLVIINSLIDENLGSEDEKKTGLINYASVNLSNKAEIRIFNDIKNLTGELKDSSRCRFAGQVFFTNFTKADKSDIRSW